MNLVTLGIAAALLIALPLAWVALTLRRKRPSESQTAPIPVRTPWTLQEHMDEYKLEIDEVEQWLRFSVEALPRLHIVEAVRRAPFRDQLRGSDTETLRRGEEIRVTVLALLFESLSFHCQSRVGRNSELRNQELDAMDSHWLSARAYACLKRRKEDTNCSF